ncbi:hypothetical protein PA0016 [Candidatus Phytoplasma australiense]|uniref:Uncharacterized protein n=1 Tax=Phytoplasma australiense TaxID=59748 RepID=B1V8W4_PHYAS|nr:hypothetical protein PA0016 [Candidatus Phytoplasma australiense]
MHNINYFFKSFVILDIIFTIILTTIVLKIIFLIFSFVYTIIKKITYIKFFCFRVKILKFIIKQNIDALDILKTKIIFFQKDLKENNNLQKKIINRIDKNLLYQTFYSQIVNFNLVNFNLDLQKNHEEGLINSLNFLFWIEKHNKQINFNNNGLIIMIDKIVDNLKKELFYFNKEKKILMLILITKLKKY